MTQQEKNELIEKCLSNSRDISLNRAYELASMAVHDQYPDDSFTEDEYWIWLDYRLIVLDYLLSKGGGSA